MPYPRTASSRTGYEYAAPVRFDYDKLIAVRIARITSIHDANTFANAGIALDFRIGRRGFRDWFEYEVIGIAYFSG
ncbi:hypothetical protein D3C72_2463190 [compost metagenome]